MELAGVILAGGKSVRMGQDKCALQLEGETFLERLVRRYRPVVDRLFLAVDRPGRYLAAGAEEVCDLRAGNQGPLAGLEAVLTRIDGGLVFLTGVDLPFGDPALLARLVQLRGDAPVCCIRRTSGDLEPLFALYSHACLPAVTAWLDEGRKSLYSLIRHLPARLVEERELTNFDLDHILMNINHPEDLRRARLIARGE